MDAVGHEAGVQAPEVVVVAYGSPDLLERALRPLAGYPLTVVDNSSRDDVRGVAERAGAQYLDPGRNLGFAGGVNVALRHRLSPGSDVLLLNPDAVIEPAALTALQAALHARPRTASVAPVLHDPEGDTAEVEWVFPSPFWIWADALRSAHRFRRRATYVHGAVLAINAAALAEVGPFDERFFLYYEETDWQYRAWKAGWVSRVVPSVHAVHVGAATSPGEQLRLARHRASHEYYLRKHYGAVGWHVARSGVLLGSAVRMAIRGGTRRARAREQLLRYVQGPASLLGRLGDSEALGVVR